MIENKLSIASNSDLLSELIDSDFSIRKETTQNDILNMMQDFLNMQQLYNAAIKEISTKLEILDDEFQVRYDHNPIHHMECRLKSPQSMMEKLSRKDLPTNLSSAKENLTDIAGIRVICNYIEDIYCIANLLIQQDDILLIRRSDYISNPKPTGYRSLHLVVKVPVFLSDHKEDVPVEIQIRTIAMDFWASLEHQLKYKTNKELPEFIYQELTECSDQIALLDQRMQNIYHQLENLPEHIEEEQNSSIHKQDKKISHFLNSISC